MPIFNAHAVNNCTGATYYDSTTDTCLNCPTGYDYNTTSGKTSISQCQKQCAGGTYVANAPDVPYGYTQLEYIGTNHNAYIISDLTVNDFDRVTARGTLYDVDTETSGKPHPTLFGASASTSSASDNGKVFRFYNGSSMTAVYGSTSAPNWVNSSTGNTFPLNTPTDIDVKLANGEQYIKINGTTIASDTLSATLNNPNNVTIFAMNYGGNVAYIPHFDCERITFYLGNDVVRDLIPARRNSDNVLGMYDTVTERFFTNSGTGSFTAGSDVGVCSDVGVGYYAPASTVNYGSVGTRTACPAGTSATNGTSASDCTACTGATYSTGGTACLSCPSGYDYNTTSGKTDATQCQIHCDAGTYVAISEVLEVPSGYTQLEYIESTGTQYIDTGVSGFDTGNWEIWAEWMITGWASNYGYVFGVYSNEQTNAYRVILQKSDNDAYYVSANSKAGGGSISITGKPKNVVHTATLRKNSFDFDGQTYSAPTTGNTIPSSSTMFLFSGSSGLKTRSRIYSTWAKKDGVLKYNLIPARRNSDNEIGMYDTVTGQFFTNSGTGSFTGGLGVGACLDVGAGYYAPASTVNYGSVGTRTACPIGTYSSITNAASCTPCSGATYNDETAQSACKSCPIGYDYNTDAGKTSATQCQIHCNAGTYFAGYTQLEYIESDGSQYIDTGYIPSNLTGIKTKVQFLSVANNKMSVYGAAQALHNKAFELYGWSSKLQFHFNTNHVESPAISVNDIVEVDWNKNIVNYSINGIAQSRLTGSSGTFTSPYTMVLFALHRSSILAPGIIKMYYFQIYDNDVLVHNFVPARRNSGNEIGLYDTVTKQFFTNSGTGSFTAGPDTVTTFGGIMCVDVGAGYYAGASTVNYGSIGTRTACPAGTFTVGYGHGADEANDCGRILHLGDSVIYTRKNKPTTPALNIRMENGDMYYIGLSTTDHTVSRLHFQTGDTKYTAFDDSLFYGERDYDTGEKITQ